jgi:hypothetical protein
MTYDITTDPRAPFLSQDGLDELKVYLQWISDNNLTDSELSYVQYAVGRAGLNDGRHLFKVWEAASASESPDAKTKLQIMRFFINPTEENFSRADVAGWFDFLLTVYAMMGQIPVPMVTRPDFKKVGFSI